MESEVLTYYYFYLSYLQKLEQFNACLNSLSLEVINSIKTGNSNQFQFDCSRSDRSSSRNDSECSSSDLNDQSYVEVGSPDRDSNWTEFKERQKNFNKYVKQRFIAEFGPIENLTYKKIKRSSYDVMNKIKDEAKQKFLPQNLTESEFKNYWKSALNTIRQTRYRYRSKLNRNKINNF
ncbi:hypothetical protein BpHYR1_038767 [Brachionus plicatilis]|uniref:Uncharacterized protein n=1 Tax=Brachionus plicatilis TaxID=10195 RepID=A0A3M7SZJ3_BRAPC|nr:hypothetical protein BpHYR1_038767 [Brachionus plicatilis]